MFALSMILPVVKSTELIMVSGTSCPNSDAFSHETTMMFP